MNATVAVVGSTNWDMSMRLPALPAPGETVLGGACHFCLGGKGANQAIAAARAGAGVFFLSCVGDNAIATEVRKELSANGLDLSGVTTVEATDTGTAMIFVDERGENCIGVASGANAHLTADIVAVHADTIKKADILLLQMEIPLATVEAAAHCHERVILNPAPAQQLSRTLLDNITILTPNRIELSQITGIKLDDEAALKNAAQSILEQGPETVLITLGKEGVFAVTQRETFRLQAFRVEAVDTTAAGDVFNGALAVALADGAGLREATEFGMAAAALSVRKSGAIPSIPYKAEIEDLLTMHRDRSDG